MKRLGETAPDDLLAWMQKVTAETSGTGPFEDLAQQAVHELHAEFPASIVLSRMYVTVPFAELPERNATWVRSLAEAKGVAAELSGDTRVISLVGSAGRKVEWNDRQSSNGHVGIPMTSASFIDAIPMMSRLMASLGGGLDWIDGKDTAQVVSRLGTVAGTFYVPDAATEVDARGRKVISATDFVAEHGIKTVFGVGGAFASGQLLVCLVFCDAYIERSVVDGFQAPFLRFKSASAPLLKQVFRDGMQARPVAEPPPWRIETRDPAQPSGSSSTCLALAEKNEQLQALNRLYLDLESQLEDRTRSLRLILDSTGEGMGLVDLDGTLYGERTQVLERWFGTPGPARRIWDYLFEPGSPSAASFAANFSQFADEVLPFELVADQLPREFVRDGISFELGYRKVQAPEQPARLLIIVRDVTSQVAAEKAAARARELHGVVRTVLRDQRGFDRFVEDTSALLSRIQASSDEIQQRRDLHTIKGNTAVMGFVTLPGVVHELESKQIEGQRLLQEDELEVLRHAWSDALSMVADFVRRGEERVEISIREHSDFVDQLLSGIDAEKLAAIAQSWRDEPTASLLRRLAAQAERTAGVLEKSIQVSIDDGGYRVPIDQTRDCWTSLVHVIRNAVDHGIEPVEQRAASGKPAPGQLQLACCVESSGEWLIVSIRDDGRGVDWEGVRQAARAASLACETESDLQEALFADGCSTRAQATGISGRGVGLGAVRAALRAAGGDLLLESTPGAGTEVRAKMPLSPGQRGSASVSTAA